MRLIERFLIYIQQQEKRARALMPRVLTLSLVLTALVSSLFLKAQAQILTFESPIEVAKKDNYSLYDLVQVTSPDESLLRELKKTSYSSYGQAELRSTLRQLRKTLSAKYPQLTLTIPTTLEISQVTFSQKELQRKILNHLSALCSDCKFEISQLSLPARTPQTAWELDEQTLKLLANPLIAIKDMRGEVFWIPMKLKIFRKVAFAKNSILQGERLNHEMIEFKETEVSRVRNPLVSFEEAQSRVAARALRGGQILSIDDLKIEDLVKSGQLIELIHFGEGFQVSTSVMAQAAGKKGDTIKVKNTTTGQILSAIVTDVGQARVQ